MKIDKTFIQGVAIGAMRYQRCKILRKALRQKREVQA